MKKVVFLFAFMLSGVSLMAQSGHRGIDATVELGYNFSTKSGGPSFPSATGIFGKRFSENFYAGAGAGVYIDKLDQTSPETLVPIFADFRGYLPLQNTTISPFLGLKGGYVINAVSSSGSDAYIFQITPGVQIPLTGVIDLNLAAGYEHWIYTQDGLDNAGMIVLRVGIGFHKK